MEIDGRPVNYVDIGEQGTTGRSCSSTASAASGRTGSRTSRGSRRSGAWWRWTCPGSGCSECQPGEQITIELYGRVVAELCERLDLAPAVLVGNSMGGFVAAEVAIRPPEIVERLMLLASAGVSQMDVAKRPVLAMAKAAGLLATEQRRADARRPRGGRKLRHWAMAWWPPPQPDEARHDVRGPDEGRRQARLRGGAARLPGVRLPRAPAGDRLPRRSWCGARRT